MEVSVLTYGASSLGGFFGEITEGEGVQVVRTALDLGINYLDVAPFYGITKCESVLGKALRGVPRESYFLATKVGRYHWEDFDFSAKRVLDGIDDSLARLRTDYVDVIQCHDIEFTSSRQIVEETLPALERARDQGKVRFIGITAFPVKMFRAVLDRACVDTVLSYSHYVLNDTVLAEELPYLETKGVGVINGSPLNMGLLTEHGPQDWHPASPELRAAAAQAAAFCRARGKDIAKLALQFSAAHPHIHTTLVGGKNSEHLRRNAAWLEEPFDEDLLAQVLEIFAPVHNQTWTSGLPENN